MMILLKLLTVLGAIFGGLLLFTTLAGANGAPQEAAGAAIAVALAVIPYVLLSMVQREAILSRLERMDKN